MSRSHPAYPELREEHNDARNLYHGALIATGVFAAATGAVVVVHLLGDDSASVKGRVSPGYVGAIAQF